MFVTKSSAGLFRIGKQNRPNFQSFFCKVSKNNISLTNNNNLNYTPTNSFSQSTTKYFNFSSISQKQLKCALFPSSKYDHNMETKRMYETSRFPSYHSKTHHPHRNKPSMKKSHKNLKSEYRRDDELSLLQVEIPESEMRKYFGNEADFFTFLQHLQNFQYTEATNFYKGLIYNNHNSTHPSIQIINLLIKHLYLHNILAPIFEYARIIKMWDISPTIETYCILIKAKLVGNNFEQSLEYLNEMKKNQLTPTLPIVNSFISYFVESSENDRFEMINYWLKVLMDLDLSPNIFTFNLLIYYYGKIGEIQSMEQILSHIKSNLSFNTLTFKFLIKSYCAVKDLTKALSTLTEMEARGSHMYDLESYKLILDLSIAIGKPNATLHLLSKLIKARSLSSQEGVYYYQLFVTEYSRTRDTEQLNSVIRLFSTHGYRACQVPFFSSLSRKYLLIFLSDTV